MTPELRTLIGVRAHGEVDSPALVYLSPAGDVVLLPHQRGDVAVTLLCSILEL